MRPLSKELEDIAEQLGDVAENLGGHPRRANDLFHGRGAGGRGEALRYIYINIYI